MEVSLPACGSGRRSNSRIHRRDHNRHCANHQYLLVKDHQGGNSLVDDNIKTSKLLNGFLERSIDGVLLGNIKINGKVVLVCRALRFLKLGGVTGSSDCVVALCDDLLDVLGTEAGGCSCDEKDLW